MNIMDFKKLAEQYKTELLDKVLPFWLNNSQDREMGGYFSCLDRDGTVYDTDKFVWLQCREVWMFAKLYNTVEKRQEWLDCAVQGAEFLKKYGHDGNYNWYFAIDREGRPLTLGIRPETLAVTAQAVPNALQGTLDSCEYLGNYYLLHVKLGNIVLVCRTSHAPVRTGETAFVSPNAVNLYFFDPDTTALVFHAKEDGGHE